MIVGANRANSADVVDAADVAEVGGVIDPNVDPPSPGVDPENRPKIIPNQQLSIASTQDCFSRGLAASNFSEEVPHKIYFMDVREKSQLGLRSCDGLYSVALADLDDHFPARPIPLPRRRDDGAVGGPRRPAHRAVLGREIGRHSRLRPPRPAHALVVLADFLRGRRVVAHNARFEASWLRPAGIDIVLDDTILMFSAVRGTRLLKNGKYIGGGSGRISLAALTTMVLDETLDKSEQVSDWSAPMLSPSQLTYAINDALVTHRIWEALRAELHRKSTQYGVDIVAGYEDMRVSAAMAHDMERVGVGFDVARAPGVDYPQAGASGGA